VTVDIICADARDGLARFPDGHFHCCVTSPPYWGLRDYGLEPTVWGDGDCEHEWDYRPRIVEQRDGKALDCSFDKDGPNPRTYAADAFAKKDIGSAFCRRCNAWRGTLGLEPTPELYVEHLVAVMREVRRVLRDDGTLWLNLGDSYAGSRKGIGADLVGIPWAVAKALQSPFYTGRINQERDRVWLAAMVEAEGCLFIHKRKVGQPNGQGYNRKSDTYGAGLEVASTDHAIVERCMAIAGIGSICEQTPKQAHRRKQTIYRWNVRSNECRWIIQELYPYFVAKHHEARLLLSCPSSGPEAAAAHESLKAIHQGAEPTIDFPPPPSLFEPGWYLRAEIIWSKANPMPESVRDRPTRAHEQVFLLTKSQRYYYDQDAIREAATKTGTPGHLQGGGGVRAGTREGLRGATWNQAAGRNRRSVWEIATQPYPDAHFATFPEKLVESCVCAGSSEWGCCPECGAPWERVVERKAMQIDRSGNHPPELRTRTSGTMKEPPESDTVGWRPTCKHGAKSRPICTAHTLFDENCDECMAFARHELSRQPVPCRVLDPSAGSGTVGVVAERLGRHSVLIDAKEEYCEMARHRTAQRGLMV
jgi:DNA modification methylase